MYSDLIIIEKKDKREEYLMQALKNDGYSVVLFGEEKQYQNTNNVYVFAMATKLNKEMVENLDDGSVVFSRGLDRQLVGLFESKNLIHIEYMDDEAFVVKNAYLTAEGALSILIQNSHESLRQLPVLVLGYGRVGKSMVKVLKDNYSVVSVATDEVTEYALASAFADNVFTIEGSYKHLPYFNAIINTVPKIILKGEILKLINKNCFVLDLASYPGGINFLEAEKLSLNVLHALGIPGKIAPKTAGVYLKDSIVERLKKIRYEQ